MKTVNSLQKLDKIIDSYLKKKKTLKPILIWFKSNLILDNFKKKLLERYKDIQCVYDIPSNPSFHFTNSSSILYHRYINQMDEDCLKYCTDLTLKNNPVIYLANEYERKNRPSFLDDKFDEIDCQVKNVIILNHMFTGKYLNENIGHEIVNLFSDDNDKQYIYEEENNTLFLANENHGFINSLLIYLPKKQIVTQDMIDSILIVFSIINSQLIVLDLIK